jgi:perosamine synthetase
MKIQRTIPPAAAPINLSALVHGLAGTFLGRRYLKKLKSEMKEYFKVRHIFLVSSGKAALTLILLALKSLSPNKKEVLIPAYTCFSVPSAIVKAGLKISLCDIAPLTFDFDYKLFEEAVTENTLCVIPDHLFGIPADMDKINSFCKDRGIFVVEDAAQAMGGMYKGKKLGTIGDAGFFSLGRGKNITCGSGGIIVTNSDRISTAIESVYSHVKSPGISETIKEFLKVMILSIFIHPLLYWFPSGLPFLKLGETMFYKEFPIRRLSGMQAGLLRGWQRQLEESNKMRKENASYFYERLRLKSLLGLRNNASISFLRLPLMVKDREIKERIYSLFNEKGLGISQMYPTPINEIEEIKDLFNGKAFPFASKIVERILTLPTHQLLSEKDKKVIVDYINNIPI